MSERFAQLVRVIAWLAALGAATLLLGAVLDQVRAAARNSV